MNEHELFQKTFSNLHASDNTLQEVMNRIYSGRGARGVSKRFAVLVAILTMLFSMALVAHATGLLADLVAILTPTENPGQVIDDAYGDSISTQKPDMFDCYGNPIEMPDMERPDIDITQAEKFMGDYISNVDSVVSIGNNTFTVKNFLIDATGTGAITWTVENPNGITYGEAGYGIVYFTSIAPFDDPKIYHYGKNGEEKKHVADYTALISKNEDCTKLELVTYFGTFVKYEIGDSFVWEARINYGQETQKLQITPTKHAPTKTMFEEGGMQLSIANHELTINFDSNNDFVADKIVINYKDGTQYCLVDGVEVYNICKSFWRSSETYTFDDSVYLFNRVIDTDQVASVEVDGILHEVKSSGTDNEYTPHSMHYVFYP